MNKYVAALNRAFRGPTLRQKEAYGRFCHTLAAASFIGGVTQVFTESHATTVVVSRILILTVTGFVLFAIGAVFCEENEYGLGHCRLVGHGHTVQHLGSLGFGTR